MAAGILCRLDLGLEREGQDGGMAESLHALPLRKKGRAASVLCRGPLGRGLGWGAPELERSGSGGGSALRDRRSDSRCCRGVKRQASAGYDPADGFAGLSFNL